MILPLLTTDHPIHYTDTRPEYGPENCSSLHLETGRRLDLVLPAHTASPTEHAPTIVTIATEYYCVTSRGAACLVRE